MNLGFLFTSLYIPQISVGLNLLRRPLTGLSKSKGNDHLEDEGEDGRTLLTRVLK